MLTRTSFELRIRYATFSLSLFCLFFLFSFSLPLRIISHSSVSVPLCFTHLEFTGIFITTETLVGLLPNRCKVLLAAVVRLFGICGLSPWVRQTFRVGGASSSWQEGGFR